MSDTQEQKEQQQSKCPYKSARTEASIGDDPQLPKREIAFYLVTLVSIITYAGHGFYLTYGQNPVENLPPQLLKKGWLRQYMDIFEVNLMTQAAGNWNLLILSSLGFLIVSKLTLALAPMHCHHIACASYTLAIVTLIVSPMATVVMLLLYATILCLSYYSFAAIWVVLIAFLYPHSFPQMRDYIVAVLGLNKGLTNGFVIYVAGLGYLICRMVSFGHGLQCRLKLQRQELAGVTFARHICNNLPLTLHYVFYTPYFWSGPVLTYDAFCQQVETRGRMIDVGKSDRRWLIWRTCRLLLWYIVLQVFYHYLPVGSYLFSLRDDVPIVYKHLSFAMFLQGQNFMLAYVQFYGWPAVLAKLDGIQLLDWPDCISWVYSYSIMWRVFDRGLFSVLQAHIYVPLGGSRHGWLRQLLGVAACFAFICIFHGDTSNVRAWIALNVAQLITERAAVVIYRNNLRPTVIKYLSPRNEKRLVGYVISWNMMVSCGIIFFLLAGFNGFIVMPEFLLLRAASRHTPFWHLLVMQTAAYCAVQIGRIYESKMHKCKGKMH